MVTRRAGRAFLLARASYSVRMILARISLARVSAHATETRDAADNSRVGSSRVYHIAARHVARTTTMLRKNRRAYEILRNNERAAVSFGSPHRFTFSSSSLILTNQHRDPMNLNSLAHLLHLTSIIRPRERRGDPARQFSARDVPT
jgi:hypothetical protein